MQLQWVDLEKKLIRREIEAGVQFVPATTENAIYREEILPMLAAGIEITPFNPPAPPPNYPGFRAAIAMAPEYERILNEIARQNPTRHASIIHVWGTVQDIPSLKLAVEFWNMGVVPVAAIAPSEAQVLQNIATQFKIPILVESDGKIQVVEEN